MITEPRITLATLPQATAQEVFDQVKEHLLTQKAKSVSARGNCAYRGEGGMMCAAGCLMSDTQYDPYMDNEVDSSWNTLVTERWVPSDHSDLIQKLQNIHDGSSADWADEMKELANSLNLIY